MDIPSGLSHNSALMTRQSPVLGGSMSSTPNTPGEETHYVETTSSLPRWVTLVFVIAFALLAYLLYAGYADRQTARKGMDDAERKTQALATELDKTDRKSVV